MAPRTERSGCRRCGKSEAGRYRTGPDGYGTLCLRCHRQYRAMQLPVYRDREGNLSIKKKNDRERVYVIGFYQTKRGTCDLNRPVVADHRILESVNSEPLGGERQSPVSPSPKIRQNNVAARSPSSLSQHTSRRVVPAGTENIQEPPRSFSHLLSVKARMESRGVTVTRRFTVPRGITFEDFQVLVFRIFEVHFACVTYTDDSNDRVTVSSDNELDEMFAIAKRASICPLHLLLLRG